MNSTPMSHSDIKETILTDKSLNAQHEWASEHWQQDDCEVHNYNMAVKKEKEKKEYIFSNFTSVTLVEKCWMFIWESVSDQCIIHKNIKM